MALSRGDTVGVYEIVSRLGAGGMGEVYRARDTRLKREVALKVLSDSFASDPDRLARLQREAELLASLNHPNIAHIHGLEEHASTPTGPAAVRALVMEVVVGEDLATKIATAAIPLDEALAIARQIAAALEAAHAQAIIHRDLKPANIKVRPDGTVKVLDFGLAKHTAPITSEATVTSGPATMQGVIVGTVAYMSPEQTRGQVTDRRTDIWAFGCVLFEMLAGRPVFDAGNTTDTMAAVVMSDPDWSALPRDVPEQIRLLLKRCLEKDRNARVSDIAIARFLMSETITGTTAAAHAIGSGADASRSRRRRLVTVGGGVLAIATVALAAGGMLGSLFATSRATAPAAVRFEVVPPAGVTLQPAPVASTAQLALSPDGKQLAFVAASKGGSSQIWLRPLDSTRAQALAGTEGASFPFWSPDSRSLAFFAGGKLKKVDIRGGATETLTDAALGRGGTWNQDGVIVFAGRASSPISRISDAGGIATSATTFDAEQGIFTQYWPQFLPDGRHFLYYQRSAQPEHQGIYVASLDSPQGTRVLASETRAVYASGHLLFVRDGILFAQPFDDRTFRTRGEPARIADGVGYWATAFAYTAVTASTSGVLAFGPSVVFTTSLRWHDRRGPTSGPAVAPRPYVTPRLSPDETSVIVAVTDAATTTQPDLWLVSLARGTTSRMTSDQSGDWFPVWSPDGNQLFFGSARNGATAVFQKTGVSPETALAVGAVASVATYPLDVSRDGGSLLYMQSSSRGYDIGVRSLAGDQKTIPYLAGPFNEVQARFSPNKRWVAFASDESGRFEVYVRAYPADNTSPMTISIAGGMQPEWRGDGKELFYIAADGKLTAVPVVTESVSFSAGTPHALFSVEVPEPTAPYPGQYAVTRDGQRFLVNTLVEQSTRPALTVVTNWTAVHAK